jgi:hypothetical protein
MDAKSIQSLEERATKIIELIKLMDKTFPNNKKEHLKLCIMAGICDAHKQGRIDGIRPV